MANCYLIENRCQRVTGIISLTPDIHYVDRQTADLMYMIYKFVDDMTLSEIVTKSATSYMKECCSELVKQWREA